MPVLFSLILIASASVNPSRVVYLLVLRMIGPNHEKRSHITLTTTEPVIQSPFILIAPMFASESWQSWSPIYGVRLL